MTPPISGLPRRTDRGTARSPSSARPIVRLVLHHLIEETARHLGHLDLLRELADGQTGEEPAPANQGT
jgi:hypothetical protein